VFSTFKIGRTLLKPGKTVVAGILNVTPDSFSDGGIAYSLDTAVQIGLRMEKEGAELLDIGGESSRPGAEAVSLAEELDRVIPVIEALRKRSSIPISIDTCKPEVALAAVSAGADAINDITGFINPEMIAAAAQCKKPVIVMHMKGNPRTMQKNPKYGDVVKEVSSFLKERAKALEKNGVKKIILDPGIGFGKTVAHNIKLLHDINKLARLGYPVMVGASRKSFIGKITGADVNDRLGGSIASHLYTAERGAAIIRVHDVPPHVQALAIAQAIFRKK